MLEIGEVAHFLVQFDPEPKEARQNGKSVYQLQKLKLAIKFDQENASHL